MRLKNKTLNRVDNALADSMSPSPITFFKAPPSADFSDRFGRRLTYLRISVTDRCNMRCDYCRPDASVYKAESHAQILRYEEIARIARVAAGLGVSKLRITGGEPLVRRDLPRLVEKLAAIPGIGDLAMTSNATLLVKYAHDLAAAGLNRINISLDSLDEHTFRSLTGSDLQPVLAGIDAARHAGLTPIKLNCVLIRGINDNDVTALITFACSIGATIRFIELMPMKQGLDWQKHYISIDEILQRDDVQSLVDVHAPLHGGNSAARYIPLHHGCGEVGFIMPMSARFCEGCNRLRLTADGGLRSCLPADDQLNLRDLMRNGGSDHEIRTLFLRSALLKPEIGNYDFNKQSKKRSMIAIGG